MPASKRVHTPRSILDRDRDCCKLYAMNIAISAEGSTLSGSPAWAQRSAGYAVSGFIRLSDYTNCRIVRYAIGQIIH